MTHYLSLWERDLELAQQIPHCVILGSGECVGRTALVVESALVADADGASVVRSGMGTYLQQLSELRAASVLVDIEVVTHGAETTLLVVAHQLLVGVVTVGTCCRAMNYEKTDALR